jgi:hypothetical protein
MWRFACCDVLCYAAVQQRFSCLPATMLSSSIYQPSATAVWEGCLNSNTYLAWYGERCGSSFNQVLWTGVYAFDKTTGARLPNCVKQRPANGDAGDAQVVFWLGACGTAPGALSSVPVRVCADPYICKSGICWQSALQHVWGLLGFLMLSSTCWDVASCCCACIHACCRHTA